VVLDEDTDCICGKNEDFFNLAQATAAHTGDFAIHGLISLTILPFSV
jgi:hypothetical protein